MAEQISSSSTPVVINTNNTVSSQLQNLIAINGNMIPFKLEQGNYAAWRAQFINILYRYDLIGFVDGSTPCPPAEVMAPSSSTSTANPEYKLWKRQDRFILHGIIGSVSLPLTSIVTSSETSHEAWSKLEKMFTNKSRTRMLGLRDMLMKTAKEPSQSVTDFLQSIKRIADDLALIGHPLSDDELVIHALNGLGNEFKEVCAAIRARDSFMSFEELHDKLQDQEAAMKRDETRKICSNITAQFTQKNSNNKDRNEHQGGNSNSGRGFNSNKGNKRFHGHKNSQEN